MGLHIEPSAWGYALRAYDSDRPNADDYVATAVLHVYGDVGIVGQISSPRMFDALRDGGLEKLMSGLKLRTLEGYMSASMARALRIACRGFAELNVARRREIDGRWLSWIVLSPIEYIDESELGNG